MTASRRPWLLLTIVVTVFVVNFGVMWAQASPGASVAQVAYASLAAFAGSYVPVGGEASSPSTVLSIGLSLALLTTLATAASVYVTATRARWSKARASRIRGAIVVIGDSTTAATVTTSLQKRSQLVVAVSPAGRTFTRGLEASTWPDVTADPRLRRLLRQSRAAVVVTDSDRTNAEISAILTTAGTSRIFRMVSAPELAQFLRPSRVAGVLPSTEVFSPLDNTGQYLSELVSGLSNRHGIAFTVCTSDHGSVGSGIGVWLERTALAQSLIGDKSGATSLRLTDDPAHADISIHYGDTPSSAVAALDQVANSRVGRIVIWVGSTHLLTSIPYVQNLVINPGPNTEVASLRAGLVVVDPQVIGLDADLVTDGIRTQWARAYHQAHSLMYRGQNPWNATTYGKNEQSSVMAVDHMLRELDSRGFELRMGLDLDASHPFTTEDITYLARSEHEDWLKRVWVHPDTGEKIPCSYRAGTDGVYAPGPDAVGYDELSNETRAYLDKVPTVVYPALVGLLGYRIVKQ